VNASRIDGGGQRWSLRNAVASDSQRVFAWRNDPAIRAVMTNDTPIGPEEHAAWYEATLHDPRRRLLVFELDAVPLGVMHIYDVDASRGTAQWGFYLRPQGAPRRSGTRMGVLALDYAFGSLGIRSLSAVVLGENERSLRMHRRLGFSEQRARAETAPMLVSFALTAPAWRRIAAHVREEVFG
jgi:UDP-4-amino-4,6-dideoxy-N-acetyl-beta-L-altrosamine N-acetyltransferase